MKIIEIIQNKHAKNKFLDRLKSVSAYSIPLFLAAAFHNPINGRVQAEIFAWIHSLFFLWWPVLHGGVLYMVNICIWSICVGCFTHSKRTLENPLVAGWATLKNISSSVGMMILPNLWKNGEKEKNVPNHQAVAVFHRHLPNKTMLIFPICGIRDLGSPGYNHVVALHLVSTRLYYICNII